VYEGVSGGDPDSGFVEGGLIAVNESTGQFMGGLPPFTVAPPTSTNDGGASWSPISTDGQYLYFGTGNTRDALGLENSVVQRNPTTMQASSYIVPTFNGVGDADVGGGELLWQGNMYFSGKTGNFYGYHLGGTTPIQFAITAQPSPGPLMTTVTVPKAAIEDLIVTVASNLRF